MSRYCPRCHCSTVVKFGRQNKRQRYRCKQCGKTWQSKRQPQRLYDAIWYNWAVEDLRIEQLCREYKLSKDKIREILGSHEVPPIVPSAGTHDILCMDCTYFGRRGIDEWGMLIVVDAVTGECLY